MVVIPAELPEVFYWKTGAFGLQVLSFVQVALGVLLAAVLDLKLPMRLAVISLNIRFGLGAGMVIPASSP